MLEAQKLRLIQRITSQGLSVEPYSEEDIDKLTKMDLYRILEAMLAPHTQIIEGRYFCSEPWIRMRISTKALQSKCHFKPVKNWKDAEDMGCLDEYFSGVKGWPLTENNVKITYANDIDDYYKNRGINNWREANDKGKLEEYFSGKGFFPQTFRHYREMVEAHDYDDFIRSLSYEELLVYLRKYSEHIPARYEQYGESKNFYQTAMSQVSQYFKVMVELPEPIYIPGDGIGIGSYVARMLGKKYYSSEPNGIGREAVIMGVITRCEEYKQDIAKNCASIFFANCYVYCIDEEQYDELKDKYVMIYDEQPPLFKNSYPCGQFKCWTNQKVDQDTRYEFRGMVSLVSYSKEYDMVSLDKLSAVLLRYVAIANDKKYVIKIKQGEPYVVMYTDESWAMLTSSDEVVKGFIVPSTQYRNLIKTERKLRKMLDMTDEVQYGNKKKILHVIAGPISKVPKYKTIYHVFKKCFLSDNINAKNGDIKLYKGELFDWYEDVAYVFDGEYKQLEFSRYERSNILETYERNGLELIARVRNPLGKSFAKVGGAVMKIQLTRYDPKTFVAAYRLLADVAYSQASEEAMRDMMW